jgi:hypothetical protein
MSGTIVPDLFKQKAWDGRLVAVKSVDVLQTAQTKAGRAQLIAAVTSHAGDYLNALPCFAVGTHPDNISLRIAVALRLSTDYVFHTRVSLAIRSIVLVRTASHAASKSVVTCATIPSTT